MKAYPKGFLFVLISVIVLLLITGLLLAPTTMALRTELPVGWRLPAEMRIFCAAWHAVGGFAMMLLMGALWSVHMRMGWRRRKQRGSGIFLVTLLLLLTLSAVVIYYAADEVLGNWFALFHLVMGLLVVGVFSWHGWRGRCAKHQSGF